MTNTLRALCPGALTFAVVWLASLAAAQEPAPAPAPSGVLFVSEHGRYMGSYAVGDSSMAVVIDGVFYRGHFSDKKSDLGNPSAENASSSGRWGRAFLFASSAKVMQCALDEGFPKVSGRCLDADGRAFKLLPASAL